MAAKIIPVLVADPHRQSRDLTMSMFYSLGLRYVWSVDTTERTQDFLDAVIFDYVLLDAQLPGGRLNILIERVRTLSRRTTVVVVSHLPNPADRFPQADIIFHKPVSYDMIQRLLSPTQATFIT